ncbi:hypothetical protein [Dictyobacter arantiisoli]|uniref:CvpA family protein n=1 Tax=Dictyobacter arantiisoli TaxID=2014874 RepID=A0A5A5TAI9_9CHLR|nr:hypothetical protein [Dictyobacter arantiisoli]GCF08530.1 hypothetical protein KDI_20940 [Dictyobacter arantiisoli]
MAIFLLALIGTLIIMACLTIGRLAFGRAEPFQARSFIRWFLFFFVFNYLFSLAQLYISLPALAGPFWGWQWVLWPLLISSVINLLSVAGGAGGALAMGLSISQGQVYTPPKGSEKISRRSIAAGIFGIVVVAVLGIAATILINVFTTWFDGNAKALAAIPHVTTAATPNLPPTDASNIVLVSQSVASYKGQQILGSTGQNLGSAYNLDPTSYTLQSINHHLYYVAELSYNNLFVNLSNPTTPGFVMVDAENPQQPPQLHTEAQATIRYLPGAFLNQDLLHHVYLSGYVYGRLADPTLELDDSLHPYWTISLMQPARGYTGDTLKQVLLVDAHTGDIKAYDPQNVPAWVDRVMPAETVTQYLSWWGLYHNAPWFNPSGLGQQAPASAPELLYNKTDQPVWLIPMTSSSMNDNSSTGIFLFDTHKNQATFYAKAAGLGIGDNVTRTFQSTRANIRGYNVASVQLYQIYNTPTWVAIYVQNTSSGDIFQAVGLVGARQLNGNNVQFDPDLVSGLRDYQQWVTNQGGSGDNGGTTSTKPQTVSGKVLRISSVVQGTNTIYYLQIAGQPSIFTANLSLSPKLPLVQSGDTVSITYMAGGGNVVNLQTFDDTSINLGSGSVPATPAAQATPAATPTVKPGTKK